MCPQASSEGELCPVADSPASSVSTLASSVIEVGVEAKRLDLCAGLDDDDDLSPLCSPPTLSITEEIMQFINESRAREGLAELKHDVDPPTDESLEDRTSEQHPCAVAQQPIDQPFSSPYKNAYESHKPRPHSREERTMEGNRTKMEDQIHTQSQATESSNASCDGGESTPLAASVMVEAPQEDSASAVELEALGEQAAPEAEDQQTIDTTASLVTVNEHDSQKNPCIDLACEDRPAGSPLPPLTGPDGTTQNPAMPKKETLFRKSDMQIIKKIRRYYEAAEAEAGPVGDGDGSPTSRRDSLSLIIPAGLVRDSVSRFAVFGHQESLCDPESGRSDRVVKPVAELELPSPIASVPDRRGEGVLSPVGCSASDDGSKTPGEEPVVVECRRSEVGSELLHGTELITTWKEKEMEAVGTCITSDKENIPNLAKGISETTACSDEAAQVITKDEHAVDDRETSSSCLDMEPKQAQKDSSVPSPTGQHAGFGRTCDRTSPTGTLEGLSSQNQMGRWSRHCQTASSTRTLYEGVEVGNVEVIGLFEATTGYPSLVENSERILSKVQMLARMYSAKSSSMKVPLHHKRACVGRAPWAPTRRTNVPAQTQLPPQHLKEGRTVKRAHSHTIGHQETISVSSDPQMVGHILVSEQLPPSYHQLETGCFLAEPRDDVSNPGSMSSGSPRPSSPTTTTQTNSQVGREELLTTAESGWLMENQSIQVPSGADVQSQNPKVDSPVWEGHVLCVGIEFPGDGHPVSGSLGGRTWVEPKGHRLYSITEDPALGSAVAASSSEGSCERLDTPSAFGAPDMQQNIVDQLCRAEPGANQMAELYRDSFNKEPLFPGGTNGAEGQSYLQITPSAEVQSSPEITSGPEIQGSPEITSGPEIQGSPEITSGPEIQGSSEITSGPEVQGSSEITPGNKSQAESNKGKSHGGTLNNVVVSSPKMSPHISPTPTQQLYISANITGSEILVSHPTPSSVTEPTKTTEHTRGQRVQESKVVEDFNGSWTQGLAPPHPSHSPLESSDRLPYFTSRRPSNLRLPTTMDRRRLHNNPLDTAVLPSQRPPASPLRPREPGQDPVVHSSGLSHNRHPSAQPTQEKPATPTPGIGRGTDAEPPCALSAGLGRRSSSPIRGLPSSSSTPSALTKSLAAYCISQSISQSLAKKSARLQSQATAPPESPTPHGAASPPPRPHPVALDQSYHAGLNGNNNNNSGAVDGDRSASHRKPPLASAASAPRPHGEPLRSGAAHSHNRVARPFSASEPSSRVQSPSPSPSPFGRICSPPPVWNQPGPLADRSPSRSTRVNGSRPFDHLGLSLELPRASSACSSGVTSRCLTSPPPIGVPVGAWGVPAPQPWNAKAASSSSSSVASPTWRDGFSPAPSVQRSFNSTPPTPSRFSPCSPTTPLSLRSTKGGGLPFFNLVDRPPSPVSNGMRSWGDNGGRSFMDAEQETGLASPRRASSSYNGSPFCLSPGALSPVRLAPGKGTLSGQHFTSIAWPDVHDLLTKYDSTEVSDQSAPASPSWPNDEWEDPVLREDICRTRLICAYVPRASPATGTAVPLQYSHRSKPEDAFTTQPAKGTIKTSYATTVNLQIAGSGRITSFSNAQVSLTQTLEPVIGDSQGKRRISVNTCNLPQNLKRL
ncbi:hypothetical protein DPEC_G00298820 [Dallia pectoralis]|uniref:Uncharacterized protein n=1 Tax=Dallia pectoralis TaxID=75939 RepID=A0ACC2FG18_DALPE|nr:hypothetical protein DPEC_G00298820 [Dallia pectoralis]